MLARYEAVGGIRSPIRIWIRPLAVADTCIDTRDTASDTTQQRTRYALETGLLRGQGEAASRIRALAMLARYEAVGGIRSPIRIWIRPLAVADTCIDTRDTASDTTQQRTRYALETGLLRGQGEAASRIRALAMRARYEAVKGDTRTDTNMDTTPRCC